MLKGIENSNPDPTPAAVAGAFGVWALLFDHPGFGLVVPVAAAFPAAVSLPVALSPRSRYLRLDSSGFEVGGLTCWTS